MARRTFLQLTGAAAGAALLAGCGERAASTAESGTELMVTVLMPGQSDETACVRISAALSEVTKQKLGFGVSIEQVAPTNYSAELWKRMVCQTMPDLFFLTENQPLDVYLNQNCILPLSALLEEYPGLKCSATSFLRNWDSILEKKRANLRSISEPARLRQPPPRSTGAAHARGRAQSIREERRIAAPPVLFALLWVRLLPALYGPFCGPLRPFGGCPWGVTPPARECLPPAPPDTRRRG